MIFQTPSPASQVFYSPDDIAKLLRNAWQEKDGSWRGECPAHNSTSGTSLKISQSPKGDTLLHCYAGCKAPAIVAALGLTIQNLFQAPPNGSGTTKKGRSKTGGQIRAEYDYVDEHGTLLYQNVRMEYPDGSKSFFQRRPGPTGAWINNVQGISPILYRLPQVLAAVAAGETIYVCEGEKDVHTLEALGLVATTNAAGADAWQPTFAEVLRGAEVVIFEDHDQAGEQRTEKIGVSLQGKAASVRVVQFPKLPAGGDVSDWLQAHTPKELLERIAAAPEWQPSPASAGRGQYPWGQTVTAPEPLRRPLPPAQPYPLEALGKLLAPAALAMQHAIQAPDAIVGQSLLAASCLAVQGHGDVLVDGRQYPISEFFLSLADSGDRKSECDRQALRPHREWMDKAMQEYTPREQIYLDELAILKKEREAILSSKDSHAVKAKLLQALPTPVSPPLPMLVCSEPTFEGLQKLYITALPSLGLFSDEGGRMLAGHALSEENRIKTIAGLSGLWDGKGVDRVRVGDGSIRLPGVRLAMHLMLQPIVAQRALADPLYQHQGFLGRCLMAWPASLAGTRAYNHVDLTKDSAYMAYLAVIQGILEIEPPRDPQDARTLKPRQLTLTPDAKAAWVVFYDHVEAQQAEDAVLSSVRSFASKAAEHCLRLAGVLALLDDLDTQQIGDEAIDNAITLTEFYITEALRLHGISATSPAIMLAERLLQWLQDRHGNELFLLQEIYQKGPAKVLQDLKGAEAIIKILIEHGYVEKIDNPGIVNGKNRKTAYRLISTT